MKPLGYIKTRFYFFVKIKVGIKIIPKIIILPTITSIDSFLLYLLSTQKLNETKRAVIMEADKLRVWINN